MMMACLAMIEMYNKLGSIVNLLGTVKRLNSFLQSAPLKKVRHKGHDFIRAIQRNKNSIRGDKR